MKLFDIILENIELDEYRTRTNDEQILSNLKTKFPNYDYNKAEIYQDDDGKNKRNKIKNVKCKIHDIYFPDVNDGKYGLDLSKHIAGRGCKECSKEKFKELTTYTKEQWLDSFNKISHFKDKIDFKNIQFSYPEPLNNGPLVTNFYCKIHKKYINGGPDNEGIRANKVKGRVNICPECISDAKFVNTAKPIEDWINEFKSNKRNKNFDFSKTNVYTFTNGNSYAFNISCNVIGLNGKKHGMFGVENKNLDNEGGINAFLLRDGVSVCPKCKCENNQTKFINAAIDVHNDDKEPRYLYDKVDFCDPTTILKGDNGDQHSRKVLIGCKKGHGYFFQRTSHHLRGSGCPICRVSKGEDYVYKLLKSKFGDKYTIDRENKSLFSSIGIKRFDFYIPELKVLIEYDGEGHFWPIFGSSEIARNKKYNEYFESDNLKNNAIKSKKSNPSGIRLIRIPYTLDFKNIDKPLLDAIKNTPPNIITYIGEYPRRHNRKEVQSQFKLTESNLSFKNILKQL